MAVSKKKFPWIDIAIGALVSAIVVLVFHFQWADPIEYKLYDMRAKLRAQKSVSDTPIILVGINDESINTIGRWPWPRTYIADAVKQLSEAGAKVIAVDVLFNDKELNPGLDEVRALKAAAATIPKFPADFAALLDTTEKKLDNDAELENEMAFAQTCVLPMYFQVGQAIGRSTRPIPEAVDKNFLPKTERAQGSELEAVDFIAPYEPFAKVAKSIGHINLSPSSDGVQREVPLLVQFNNRVYPSLALQSLRAYYNLESEDYRYNGNEVILGRAHIPVDGTGRMLVNYFGAPYKTFPTVSFSDLRNNKIQNMDAFRDKIVLIGMMATGGGDLQTTPVGDLYPGVELQANIIQSVLSNTYITRPPWATKAELGILIFFGLFVSLAIPYLSAGRSAVLALILLIATLGGGVYAFTAYGFWLKMLYPSMLLVAGYAAVISTRYFATQKHELKLEGESAESNKMLGLSFQGQGMLDMAFEKFRRCPIDESMKECLYNLALDFERKRQFNKAVSVLDHLMTADKKYKDVAARASQLRIASETVILGKGGKSGPESTVMLEHGPGVLAKPTLGRYEVLKELGKGAMGIVYLGKDPKINREVAIKTLRFEEEFEAADMAVMKERFFREAESAGRLVHPNIVTIYDAGDDGDISYIAMELLNGVDLKEHVRKDALLPVNVTLENVAKVADALNYAHGMGIVHRDIKPANIMLLKDGTIKVTDFGIARITSQSKTATGTVMGTPSYMAPEQLAGQKVDGRADLFSLGVTMYELLTGEKPFTGESIATLMYRIANEPHPPIRRHRIELPTDIEIILDRVLAKNPDERYQHGSELASDLRKVIQKAIAAGA